MRERISRALRNDISHETREKSLQFIMFFSYLLEIAVSVLAIMWEQNQTRTSTGVLAILFSICAIVCLVSGRLDLERVFCLGLAVLLVVGTITFSVMKFDGNPISSEIVMNRLLQITLFNYRVFSIGEEMR